MIDQTEWLQQCGKRRLAVAHRGRDAFEARLLALSRAHDILTRESWASADLRGIAAQAVRPFLDQESPGAPAPRITLDGPDLRLPPEGALAPDTYEVNRGGNRRELIDRMRAAQDATLTEAWDARPFGLPYQTPEEALTMASIVEKETGIPEERRRVAAVFVNRLREGMRLQTDPTVIYGVTNGREVLDRGLRRSELDRKTPYNTYQIDGLPPGPIANPGKAAIEAALNPDDSAYLYFVADGSGGHAFARTLAEHEANVARWREIERAQGADTESPVQTD